MHRRGPGGPRKFASVDLPVIQEYQIRIQGAATYRWEDFDDAVDIIASDDFDAVGSSPPPSPSPERRRPSPPSAAGGEVKILVIADRGDR